MNVAGYIRVSTKQQKEDGSHENQRDELQRWAERNDHELECFEDIAISGQSDDRPGYQAMMDRADEFDAIVVNSVSRLARSVRDFEDVVDRIVEDAGTELHIISEGFEIRPDDTDPYQRAMLQMLSVFAELEAEMAQARTREGLRTRMANDEYHHGPAPLGFEKNDGRLIEAAEYDHVVVTLQEVAAGNLSKRKAARELDCARATISRALDRNELYGIET